MTDQEQTPASVNPIEAVKLFNEFQSQSRARIEATLKLVLVISGGMLTLSVGAIFGNTPPNLSGHLLTTLMWGWGFLFYSMAASLMLMASMIIATFHMGVRWRKNLEDNKKNDFVFVATWSWLRVLNAALGISVLCSCVTGIALMAYVSLGVASAQNVTQSPSCSNAVAPVEKPNLPFKRTQ